MNIIEELTKVENLFKENQEKLNQKQKEIVEIEDELKRLQGEYRVLVKFGQEQGLIDDNGVIIKESTEE